MENEGFIKGEPSRRKIKVFYLLDNSASMQGAKIQALNRAVKEAIATIKGLEERERLDILVASIAFGEDARWHIGPDPVSCDQFLARYRDLDASERATATAQAIRLLCEALDLERMGARNVPPVCILFSDGHCTEPDEDYDEAIATLNSLPWGAKAVRMSIGIGDFNKAQMDAFISPYLSREQNIETLEARDVREIKEYIKTVSTVAITAASRSKSGDSKDAPVQMSSDVFADPTQVF